MGLGAHEQDLRDDRKAALCTSELECVQMLLVALVLGDLVPPAAQKQNTDGS